LKAPKLYIFSGLGADHRVFQLMDFGPYEIHHIKWITPIERESIEAYTLRISKQITTENPVLVGLSFGGMMAMEVAKIMPSATVILLASAKTRNELPLYFKVAGKLGLHHLLPLSLLTGSNFMTNWFFGAKSPAEKHLLAQILGDIDHVFLKWAIHQIVNWQNSTIPAATLHIHGSADRILPIRYTKPDIIIPGGNHFMTFNQSKELSLYIQNYLRGISFVK
jgi:pimeloyl-ACP methyl ester carboxylesterase